MAPLKKTSTPRLELLAAVTSSELKMVVRGALREITDIRTWRYVPGNSNPSDIPTRDINLSELQNLDMWWEDLNSYTKTKVYGLCLRVAMSVILS